VFYAALASLVKLIFTSVAECGDPYGVYCGRMWEVVVETKVGYQGPHTYIYAHKMPLMVKNVQTAKGQVRFRRGADGCHAG
jgi:hypothetical protein